MLAECKPMQIVGDDKELAILIPHVGVFVLKNSIISCMDFNEGFSDIVCASDKHFNPFGQRMRPTVTLTIHPELMEIQQNTTDLISFNIFRNTSIKELLKIVQEKIRVR